MPIDTVLTLYTYDELASTAKAKAKDWWLSCRDETDYESVIDDFTVIAETLGIDLKTHAVTLMSGKTRQDANVWYSVGYCQSDFAAFDGAYQYAKGSAKAIRQHAPKDSELQRIADELAKLQKANAYQLRATVAYHKYYGLQSEVIRETKAGLWVDPTDGADMAFSGLIKDLAKWLYRELVKQDEWISSDENIAESMEANEYTFREDGRREG